MSVLIIHPQDPTTDFLKLIYAPIQDKTIITGGITKNELKELIKIHDRVILLGHGSPNGLLSVGQFPKAGNYIIDRSMVDLLSTKTDNIYIWCYANQFVKRYHLAGFYSGMFVSEISEANYYDFWDMEQQTIVESNDLFAESVSKYINEPLSVMYRNVLREYGILGKTNPIAEFNLEQLYINSCTEEINSICNTVSK